MSRHYPIAIIGGGLGGLVAARVLHTRGIDAALFERELDRHTRVQGGMLDIHEENGQQALRAAGLFEQFLELVHPGGEAMRVLDRHGVVHREEADNGEQNRPEVDRGQLRDLLIDSLPADTIHWGHRLVAVRALEKGSALFEVEFADGQVITTDLLVGADGAWSKVRPLLSAETPSYTGVSFIEIDLHDADTRHPAEAAVMGGGMLFALGGDTGVLGHKETDGSLHVYLGHRADESWLDTIDFTDTEAARAAVLDLLDGWDESLRGLVAQGDTPFTPRRIHALPVDHSWARVPGVTLLGDAAHVMSPFAGEGANLAMYDGFRLAEEIATHSTDIEAALTAYESDLFPRSSASAAESAASLEIIFSADSPAGLLAMFAAHDDAPGKDG